MSKYLVCVSDTRHTSYKIEQKILSGVDAELRLCNCITEEDVIEQCAEADAILLDMAPMTAKVIQSLKKCKVINRYGVGYDNVDIPACTAQKIQVTYVPDYCMEDVSDHALALMMACLRHVALRDRMVRQGAWNIEAVSYRLNGKTLGIIGAGRIARTFVRKVSGFGLKEILAYDPYVSEKDLTSIGVHKVELKELLENSDIISLHLHVNDETRGIINEKTLAMMKRTAILINVSRGALVCDEALLAALRKKEILAAGLDTHCCEPLTAASEYCKLDNVVLTDHTAYNTVEGVDELKTKSALNVLAVLQGKKPMYSVNQL